MTTSELLRRATLEDLERLYRDAPLGPAPTGRLRGQALARVVRPWPWSAAATAVRLPFQRLPFWVDFATRTWAFVHPRLRLARFRVEPGRSRWRDTATLRLRYDTSRLPFRGLLYDEIKPLDQDLCLGLGGIDRGRGHGELFFFLLAASPSR